MAGTKYFRWMPGDWARPEMILGGSFWPWVRQLKYLQDEYRYDIIAFAYFRPLKNLWQARNNSGGCRVTDCGGSEIILASIFWPWVRQLKYLQDEYRYDIIVFAHFRPLKNLWQGKNILGGCRVTVPDRKCYWGPSSGHGSGS